MDSRIHVLTVAGFLSSVTLLLISGCSARSSDGVAETVVASQRSALITPATVTPGCTINTVAGHGVAAFAGDGGPATQAAFTQSFGVAADAQGNFYIADQYNSRVRKVSPSGVISTFAGNGSFGISGDGGPATLAQLRQPWAVKVDSSGNVYILDQVANNVRKVSPTGIITTVAGSPLGTPGSSGNFGPATAALLRQPTGLAVDDFGNLFIADAGNAVIREVDSSGIMLPVAGTMGSPGNSGDGSPNGNQINLSPSTLSGMAVVSTFPGVFTLYFNDTNNYRVRKFFRSGKFPIVDRVAGTGVPGNSGDGGPALSATFTNLQGLALDNCGNLILSDANAQRLRKIDLTFGTVSAVAGTGAGGFSGDGGPGGSAAFNMPEDLAVQADGSLLIMDRANIRVRRIAGCASCSSAH